MEMPISHRLYTKVVRLVDGELTIVVGNEPGTALPHTGGQGGAPYRAVGLVMMALAGMAGLGMSRRRRYSRKRGGDARA